MTNANPTPSIVSRETIPQTPSTSACRSDLHVHTTVSDGSDTFDQVLQQAHAHALARIALTNHDTTAHLDQAISLGDAYGIAVVGGVEISACDQKRQRKIHILGLYLREQSPAIEALCAPLLQQRNENSHWQLDRLVEAGYALDVEKALGLANASTCLYKQHLMAALTGAPYNSAPYRTLYQKLFKNGGICDRDISYVDARDAVAAIVEDGGVAVLAHPGQLNSYDYVPELADAGLGGIERYHPDHTTADHERCFALAARYHLTCTSGSDYHGTFGKTPHPGFAIPCDA